MFKFLRNLCVQKFADAMKKRTKREAETNDELSVFDRGSSDLKSSSSNQHNQKRSQQPLVPFDSFPQFNFPSFGERGSREATPRAVGFSSSSRRISKQKRPVPTSARVTEVPRSKENNYTPASIYQAEGQVIYPSINGRSPFTQSLRPSARSASNRRPFYPSPKTTTSGQKSRGSSNSFVTLPNGFRDFHETFYGHQDRGERKRPASPSHRQNDYAPVDNSLLGSGNFEVISGGTFYEDDSQSSNRHPYDSFLDNGYPYNEKEHSFDQPHTNNYVDDFFSNFRDFSEFAVRRADKPESEDFFSLGSESVNKYIISSPAQLKKQNFQANLKNKKTDKVETQPELVMSYSGIDSQSVLPHSHSVLPHPPRNIQEVLQQVEAEPSNQKITTLSVEEKDPMIATF